MIGSKPEIDSVWIFQATNSPVVVLSLHTVSSYHFAIVRGIKHISGQNKPPDEIEFQEYKVVLDDLYKLYTEHYAPSQRTKYPCAVGEMFTDAKGQTIKVVKVLLELCLVIVVDPQGNPVYYLNTEIYKLKKIVRKTIFEHLLMDED